MLGEDFVRLLCYREEKKFDSSSEHKQWKRDAHSPDSMCCESSSADPQVQSAPTGPDAEDSDSVLVQGLRDWHHGPSGLSIPGRLAVVLQPPAGLDDCSLLDQYPDLQVTFSGHIPHNPIRTTTGQMDVPTLPVSISDQGYLAMGPSVTISLDLPEPGLEPMSNSVLNGLLEKQLEEVYMQHLTDNLARCNSHLLHSLVSPLHPQEADSRDDSQDDSQDVGPEEAPVQSGDMISYLNTHNLAPCSSNFSSPLLRISEVLNPPQP